MSHLEALFDETGRSPWLNSLTRSCLRTGRLAQLVKAGVRGVLVPEVETPYGSTSMTDRRSEEPRLMSLNSVGLGPEEIAWELAVEDTSEALAILRPVWERRGGADGFVSVGLPPALADDTEGIVASTRALYQQIGLPNLLVAVPATAAGLGAIRQLTAEGWSTNATMVFSLSCYHEVIDAYLEGLEVCPGDLSSVHSLVSFDLDRIDDGVDRALEGIGSRAALDLGGQAGKAFARAAYETFAYRFGDERWMPLRDRSANVQRPLWVRTRMDSALDTWGVGGPGTIFAMCEEAISAFEEGAMRLGSTEPEGDSGTVVLDSLCRVGIDLEALGADLQRAALAERAHSYSSAVDSVARRVAKATSL